MSDLHYPINVRAFDRSTDGDTVAGWTCIATGTPAPLMLMPPVGLVGTDASGVCAAAWLHLSMNVGVCLAENLLIRPDLTEEEGQTAALVLLEALKCVALTHDYGVMTIRCGPAFAAFLQQSGFRFSEQAYFTGVMALR